MKPAAFRYHAPKSLGEALAILTAVAPEDGRVLAGGQSLIPAMALRMAKPPHLVDINGIDGAGLLELRDGMLCIGPCVRHAGLQADAAPGPLGRLLAEVQRHIAHLPIRQRGTFCGSLANADPASEWSLVAATLGAEMVLSRQGGERVVPAAAFTLGIMATALLPEEILTQVRLPLLAEGSCVGFQEVSRRAGDFAQAMALAVFTLRDGVIVAPRLGLGAVEDRPRRLRDAEAVLEGQLPSAAVFRAAAAAARPGLVPLDDDPYRLDLAEAMIRRALAVAAGLRA
jgi:carbon-monoxide dehydrogenase medium subunit